MRQPSAHALRAQKQGCQSAPCMPRRCVHCCQYPDLRGNSMIQFVIQQPSEIEVFRRKLLFLRKLFHRSALKEILCYDAVYLPYLVPW